MIILVTGAAGFIGSHTVDRLLEDGHQVVGLDNLRTGRKENLRQAGRSPRFLFEQIDITEQGCLDAVVGRIKPDAIIHLAALVSVQESMTNPTLNRRLNVEATRSVVRAASTHQVPRIVFASSAAVYGDCAKLPLAESSKTHPLSPYGAAKLESEKLLFACSRVSVPCVVCLRYFNVYGLRQNASSPYSGVISIFARQFAAGRPIVIYGDGNQTRDFIHVNDVARANAQAATLYNLVGRRTINICTGRATSLNQLSQIFRGFYPEAAGAFHAAARPGDIAHSCGNPSSARALLGFSAEVLIEQGLQDFAAVTIQ